MKKNLIIAGLLSVVSLAVFGQSKRIVDGIGGGGKYANISDAISAAAAGDTIDVLQGTYTEAQAIDVTKRLVIQGAGYRTNGTVVRKIGINFSDAADNSRLYGFRFDTLTVTLQANADNVLIADNYFIQSTVTFNGNTGDTIRNNIFLVGTSDNSINSSFNTGLTNIVICNNIFDGSSASNNSTFIYLRVQDVNQNGIKIFNNYFGESSYAFASDWSALGGTTIVGNIFFKLTNINNGTNIAQVYSGNWLFGITGTPLQPSNGIDNGSGDPQFTRFDQTKGYVFLQDTAQDTDFRIKNAAAVFPSSPIDASYRPISPMPLNYVDVQQQPGNGNTNRADAGIFGGPFPFKSPFVPSTTPGVNSISATSTVTGGVVVSPTGVIKVDVTGSFGGSATPQ